MPAFPSLTRATARVRRGDLGLAGVVVPPAAPWQRDSASSLGRNVGFGPSRPSRDGCSVSRSVEVGGEILSRRRTRYSPVMNPQLFTEARIARSMGRLRLRRFMWPEPVEAVMYHEDSCYFYA